MMSSLAAVGLYWLGVETRQPETVSQVLAAGCAAGILITPDLDVDNPVRSHYVVFRRFGPALAAFWRLFWLPYGLSIRHRSWVSHMPVVGTLIRVAYLACLGSLALWLLRGKGIAASQITDMVPLLPWAVIGLVVSDTLHWVSDNVCSGFRRRLVR
jgi:uncharacterized metal-binding protein